MRRHSFKYTPGIYIGAALVLAGMILQSAIGGIDWDMLAFPVNAILLADFVAILLVANSYRRRVHAFHWLGSGKAATTSVAWTALMTAIMGLIRQDGDIFMDPEFPGFSHMLSNWSFVLVYAWMTVSLGMAVLSCLNHFRKGKIPFLLSHLGLFIVLVCGVAGSADMKRWQMTAFLGESCNAATDSHGQTHRTPFTITLKSFDIQEYEPGPGTAGADTYPAAHEIKNFVSKVEISTQDRILNREISVNRPCRFNGWKIYQKNYDHLMGRQSRYSVLEIIRDPWMPAVYTGFIMMIAGAMCMMVRFGRKEKEHRHE